MANHGATAHAAKESCHRIGDALRDTFLGRAAAFFFNLADEVKRKKAFNQANRSEDNGVRQNDFQHLHAKWDLRNMERRQAALDRGHVAHARNVNAESNHDSCNNADTRKRGWNELGDFGCYPDQEHGQRDKTEHEIKRSPCHPCAVEHIKRAVMLTCGGRDSLELCKLGEENNNGEAVDEP